jgi:hypothetical protein
LTRGNEEEGKKRFDEGKKNEIVTKKVAGEKKITGRSPE